MITDNPDVDMSWMNYKSAIVNTHQVILEGWPSTEFDLGQMGTRELERVMDTLEGGECAWWKLSDEELELCQEDIASKKKSGEIQVKKWKQRCDKGSKRGNYRKKGMVVATLADEDVSNGT